ncbi:hypothetical protein IFM89_034227 [Coptis chinensis]|uniref:Uncharacterized protein n=1 Tax=Coptis chinensis TaxID=261450 RepID=A0A835H6R8_9MAGN|nr:hypothetical protein IFM89_034227 [Coptis chinensis]
MIHLLKKPPKHFEEFVNEHFRAKAETILVACKAYMAGEVKVGDVVHSENPSSPVYRVSQRFQTSMHDLYPLLLNWFADKGAPVEKYRAEVQFLSKSGVIMKRGDGIAKKSFAKLKRLFGCSVKIEDNKDKIVTDG